MRALRHLPAAGRPPPVPLHAVRTGAQRSGPPRVATAEAPAQGHAAPKANGSYLLQLEHGFAASPIDERTPRIRLARLRPRATHADPHRAIRWPGRSPEARSRRML